MKFRDYMSANNKTQCLLNKTISGIYNYCFLQQKHIGNHKFERICGAYHHYNNNGHSNCLLKLNHSGEHRFFRWHWIGNNEGISIDEEIKYEI